LKKILLQKVNSNHEEIKVQNNKENEIQEEGKKTYKLYEEDDIFTKLNDTTKQKRDELGEYKCDDDDVNTDTDVENRKAVVFDSEAVYEGQWKKKTNERCGFGVMI
jgi:hypothetical protein